MRKKHIQCLECNVTTNQESGKSGQISMPVGYSSSSRILLGRMQFLSNPIGKNTRLTQWERGFLGKQRDSVTAPAFPNKTKDSSKGPICTRLIVECIADLIECQAYKKTQFVEELIEKKTPEDRKKMNYFCITCWNT